MMSTRTWADVKTERRARGLAATPEQTELANRILDEYIHAHRLAEIRKQRGRTQSTLAHEMGVAQARISQIENADLANTEIATLQSYITALGGRVRILADFGDTQVPIA